tara:strand:- start:125 stop:388 length:264 start_codon:yes stop_codon:yes gene_type:complete
METIELILRESKMETVELILLIVSLHLALKLVSNFFASGEREKKRKDIRLILAYLENNERDRLAIINEQIPMIEQQLIEIHSNTRHL